MLLDIQKEIQNNPYTVAGQQVLRVRALSLQESPFRGCLGGTDCSTDMYFDLALDPNFIYFTLTDTEFKSSGHITVVLGTAHSEKERGSVKIAFVDKIQNVPQVMILPMLEAIRLSLKELSYRLGLPVDVGNSNGLSNMETISAYIDSEVNPLFTHQLKNFKPHKSPYDFDRGYSRAYSKPNLLEFERQEGDFKIEAGEINERSKIPEDLKVEDLFKEILSWKDSKREEDQIQFISHLRLLTEIEGLGLSEGFATDYLKSKIKDKKMSFKVRKIALYTLLEFGFIMGRDEFLNISENFSQEEQIEILGEMSNWKNSNNYYRKEFIKNFSIQVIEDSLVEEVLDSPLHRIFDIHVEDIDGQKILFTDMKNGYQDFLSFLLDDGNRNVVQALLEKGVDVNTKDNYGSRIYFRLWNRVLIRFVENNDQAIVRLLVEMGLGIHDRYGQRVLFIAVERGNQDMVRLLVKKGVNINARNDSGETVLFTAVKQSDQEMVRLLVEMGVDIDAKNGFGETVLFIAVESGDQDMVRLLVEMGVDIDAKNGFGQTVLFVAVGRGDQDMVRLLVEMGADIDSNHNQYGGTVLFLAVERGDQDMIRLLVKMNVDVNARDKNGETVLSFAEEMGNENIVRLLREKEADMQAQNNSN